MLLLNNSFKEILHPRSKRSLEYEKLTSSAKSNSSFFHLKYALHPIFTSPYQKINFKLQKQNTVSKLFSRSKNLTTISCCIFRQGLRYLRELILKGLKITKNLIVEHYTSQKSDKLSKDYSYSDGYCFLLNRRFNDHFLIL